MSIGVRVQYWLVWALSWLVGLLPAWFLYYVLLEIIYFLVYRVVRYRVKVVRSNLSASFPEKTKKELRKIERKFYHHLTEVMIDTVDMVSMSKKQLKKRMVFEDIENHEQEVKGKNWIAALAHYGSWEYFSAYQLFTTTQVVGVYHRLHSEAFDEFYRKLRVRFGLEPVRMVRVMRYIIENKDREGFNFALGLISDQSPRRSYPDPHWHWFLNQKTAFFNGMEAIAKRYGMPVYFMHVTKLHRRRYKAHFEMIYDGTETIKEGEITERYARKLEAMIIENPEIWMWSHRRWKSRKGVPSESEMFFPHLK